MTASRPYPVASRLRLVLATLSAAAVALTATGCATAPGQPATGVGGGGTATSAAPASPRTPGCKSLGVSQQTATLLGVGAGTVIGVLAGREAARNPSVGARNGALLGALAGGLIGSQFGSAIKTIQMPDGSVRLDIPGSVLFPSGNAAVNDGAKSTLDAISRTFREYCDLSAHVVGHTDGVGRRADNQVLALNRARSVTAYLTATGIPAGRLSAEGQGPDQPIADNATEAGRQQNRRVEIFVRPPAP